MTTAVLRRAAVWAAPLGFALIAVGYLQVWQPHPAVGLALIGLEMGEWVKFLPAVQQGLAPVSRNLFYLPPITLGLAAALITAAWPAGRNAWIMRALAVGAALLAMPAVPVMLREPSVEWRLRLALIGLVGAVALAAPLLGRLPHPTRPLLLLGIALAGAYWPTRAAFAMRPLIAELLGEPLGIGPGVWLNLGGHVLLAAVAVYHLLRPPQPRFGR